MAYHNKRVIVTGASSGKSKLQQHAELLPSSKNSF